MKILLVSLLNVALLFAQSVDRGPSTLSEMKISGKVKSCTLSTYHAVTNGTTVQRGTLQIKSIYYFDSLGYCTSEKTYNSQNVYTGQTTYLYNKDGYLLEKVSADSKGNIFYKKVNTYNEHNDVIQESIKDEFSITNTVYSYTYDEQRHQKEKREESATTIYTYNENNVLQEYLYTDASGVVSFKVNYYYDLQGNLIKETSSTNDGLISTKLYNFDSQNRQLELIKFDGQSPEKSGSYGRGTCEKHDMQGNWQKSTLFMNNNAIGIIERQFLYY